ncbi:drug/metabolite transporter, EamA family [Gottschalkia acidurici 9a]|uniref:Drug/metabolite transporter, EamA family n=1 Tax=Gottschalkia acidurici (strain ATCC 7906 / DSM 604 / BCRC 14475 / CIP 104303 / KCTC 5404 / NCIMB 10678 / 9a) TaxID=1128398 RepID=K0B506_GOTA9|nr:DMT family transporter [Gottschalkia acidurici]AFS79646.1 drug/metabolite transporter, EamA family [Gottschalkia acidurici 9a]
MKNKIIFAHLITLVTVFIWGTTFISTKVILEYLSPVEILFYRFLIGYLAMLIIHPKFKKIDSMKDEILFFSLGLTGVTLYFLVENIALDFTLASNVGLIVSINPIITAIIAHIFTRDEKISKMLVIGCLISILGVFLVIFNGTFRLDINPLGDILALIAAILWALYSLLLKKVDKRYSSLYVVRRTFFYGLITMIPAILLLKDDISFNYEINLSLIYNMIFLGLGASALCFVLWNKSISIIGIVKASSYIYLVPLITMVTSAIVLREKISVTMIIGCILILIGVYISERKLIVKSKDIESNNLNT